MKFPRRSGVLLHLTSLPGPSGVGQLGEEAYRFVDFLAEVERFGYRFGPSHKIPARGSRGLMIRMGICIAAAMNVMIFSLCFYLGLTPED